MNELKAERSSPLTIPGREPTSTNPSSLAGTGADCGGPL